MQVSLWLVLVIVIVALALAIIPARIAWKKHRRAGVWYAFGFFLFIPAIIAAFDIKDRTFAELAKKAWGDDWQNVLAKQRETPTDAGWYVDRSHEFTLRWWDGSAWTNAWMRVDGDPLPRPAGEEAWNPSDKFFRESWSNLGTVHQPA